MIIQHFKTSQMIGVRELEFAPGLVNIISGRNGSGKTSTLDIIKATLQGGNEATLLRNGAERGESVLVFDDNLTVERRVGRGSGTTFTHPKFGPLSKPQTRLDAIVDSLAINPVQFIVMPAKERAKYLLELCPIEVTSDELRAAVGEVPLIGLDEYTGLELIERNRKAIYEQRTSTNGGVKERRSTIKQLEESLPSDVRVMERDYAADMKVLEEERASLHDGLSQTLRSIAADTEAKRKELAENIQRSQDQLNASWDKEIATIDAQIRELEKRKSEIVLAKSKESGELRAEAERESRAIIDAGDARYEDEKTKVQPRIAEIDTELTRLREAEKHVAQHRTVAKLLAGHKEKLATLEQASAEQTAAIAGLEELKLTLLSRIPIAGIEITDGELYVDGVPFDRVNTARKVRIAFELALLRMGEARLICVDNLECLDTESFNAFIDHAQALGDVQLFVTRVSDEALNITTIDKDGNVTKVFVPQEDATPATNNAAVA